MTERIPYTVIPHDIGDFLQDAPTDSALHVSTLGEAPIPLIDPRPYCDEHGLMAQGFDSWYCEDCETTPQE